VAETRARKARAAAMTPAQRAASAIRKGECDADLADVLNALMERVSTGEVALRWRLDLDDLHVTEEDLTLGEADMLERLLGCTWGEVNPLKSAEHAAALIRVCLVSRTGITTEEASDLTKGYPVKRVVDAITQYAETDPPKA
jgi:hypothetical protein